MQDIIFFGETTYRNIRKKFGIKRADRRQHMYIIGKTGVGKSSLLKNMASQDIINGEGVGIIDPHGEFAEEILDRIPSRRINDVVYFNPADMDYPISFNALEVSDKRYKHLVASGLMSAFTKIWANVWSARMEYILSNCILALLDTPGSTLLGVLRMLNDKNYRQKIVDNVKDPVVKSFWLNEYEEWDSRYRNEAIAPIQNKVGQFLNVALIRNIVGQSKSTINISEIMDKGKILIMNLSKGNIGEDNASLLGAIMVTKIQLAAMERVRIPENKRKDFYLYVDEFQNFVTQSFADILSEARKYRLNLIIAHQYINQLVINDNTTVRDAVFGNVGTLISFRVGAADAEFLEKEFKPEITADDLVSLPNYHIYLKLMINGQTSRPFSAKTLPPIEFLDESYRDKIIKVSRERYGSPRQKVEEKIMKWSGTLSSPTFYNVKCSVCGASTKVSFLPDKNKPIYCRSCLAKMDKKKEITKDYLEADKNTTDYQDFSALRDLGIEFFSDSLQLEKEFSQKVKNKETTKLKNDKKRDREIIEVVSDDKINEIPAVSLKEIIKKGIISFGKNNKNKKKVKEKKVNTEEVKNVLKEIIKDESIEKDNEDK